MLLLPFERWICLLLATGLIVMLAGQMACCRRQRNLLLIHSADGWTLRPGNSTRCVSGALIQAGYRSAWLVILVIQSRDTAWHRVAIWQDQVSPREFSYLHQQLAFAAEPPTRRSPVVWLKDLIGLTDVRTWSSKRKTTLRRRTRSSAENTLD